MAGDANYQASFAVLKFVDIFQTVILSYIEAVPGAPRVLYIRWVSSISSTCNKHSGVGV
ncbi:hypothetical protein GGD56_004229 [Rhizobium mongolense]|uniref:Uncharacterized protein n=2 Tax=Rhizobium mongolense TaxID=57676 RepID=A0ABR6IR51_9HYPH|nr:hypothetical protein [Rhizobium mongolense]TVZ65549.1 hypothetical protein BCL32_5859 [Rhizobium mongolense USDA 1844]